MLAWGALRCLGGLGIGDVRDADGRSDNYCVCVLVVLGRVIGLPLFAHSALAH